MANAPQPKLPKNKTPSHVSNSEGHNI